MLQNDLGPCFKLGLIAMTLRAQQVLSDMSVFEALLLHMRGEWGGITQDDHYTLFAHHDFGVRMRGAYCDRYGQVFWIITNADRSQTTVMMSAEYLTYYATD